MSHRKSIAQPFPSSTNIKAAERRLEDEEIMATNQSEIERCEREIRENAEEIVQLESELMSPDCNLEGIKERDAQLKDKQSKLQRELIALKTSHNM
jgi:septal ring factor EnvC (AmiA/AmiB activator)